uniref:Uncharacterized protein n=1 Tax=Anguilla anguilla TaxID=7936 RepID=A0A0E9X9Q1_ANGAN
MIHADQTHILLPAPCASLIQKTNVSGAECIVSASENSWQRLSKSGCKYLFLITSVCLINPLGNCGGVGVV